MTSTTIGVERRAGTLQGWVLVATAWLSVIASSMLAPILPRMAAAFHDAPGSDVKIRLVATLPALFVAILATPFGYVADRVGHKRVLLWTLLLYGFVGTAPFWLHSLDLIVVSRGLVGVAEAAIMTCGTALIGDYFSGKPRERWLAMQTGTAPIISTTVIVLGGALGEQSWRFPFAAYTFGFILVPLVLFFTWEARRVRAGQEMSAATASASAEVNWPKLIGISLVTVFALTAFLVTIIQIGFLLTERGMTSPRQIGLWSALASCANPIGAVIFGLTRWRVSVKLLFSFALFAVGFALMALVATVPATIIGAIIANIGAGVILPTLITWALSGLPPEQRGRGTGLWMSGSFLGQFLSPLVVLFLSRATGSLSHAILCYAVACGAAAAISLLGLLRRPGPPPLQSA